jgi:hypothetical protein
MHCPFRLTFPPAAERNPEMQHSQSAIAKASDPRTPMHELRRLLEWCDQCRASFRPLTQDQSERLDDLEKTIHRSFDRLCNAGGKGK